MDQATAMALAGLLLTLGVPRSQWYTIQSNWPTPANHYYMSNGFTSYPYANMYTPEVILQTLLNVATQCGMTSLVSRINLSMSSA
jgi:hypothetical protein